MATAVQAFTALCLAIPYVLAPAVAPELGMPAQRVGLLVSLSFFAGIVSGLACASMISRFGPIGTLRIALVLAVAGLATAAGAQVTMLVLFALLCGFAHGLVNPPTSQVLMAAAPPRMRSLIFSIKQTGVPLGMAIAGAVLPLLLLVTSWQRSVIAIAVAGLSLLLVLAPFRALYDTGRDRTRELPVSGRRFFSSMREPLAASLASPQLRQFILGGGVFGFVQPCVTAYLVSYLNLDLGYSLLAAGLVFSAATVASVLGRIVWGALADGTGSPRRVLGALGIAMGICCLVAAAFSPQWPRAAVIALCAVWGASAVGWNGVFLAEVARLAPEGKVGLATGGSQVYLFTGAVTGPPLFGLLASTSGFSVAYLLLGIAPIIAGAALFRRPRAPGRGAP